MQHRLDYLDSSRGIAALFVLFSHFFGAYGLFSFLKPFDNSTLHFMWHGEGAVTYFYVLSGYVLTIGFSRDEQRLANLNLAGFVVRRFFRIFPLFLVCISISFILMKIYASYNGIITDPARSDWVRGLWANDRTVWDTIKESMLIIPVPAESSLRLIPQDWTLRIEFIYSSIIPIALLILNRGRSWFFLFLAFLMFVGNFIFFAFALGILAGRYSHTIQTWLEKINLPVILLIMAGALCLYAAPYNFLRGVVTGHATRTFVLESMGSFILLACILGNRVLRNLLSHPILTFLGKISYGIYLTHLFLLIAVIPPVINMLNQYDITDDFAIRFLSLTILILLTISVSYTLHTLIERSANELGKRVTAKYFTTPVKEVPV
jgi:peptidoglycan/LPS O-acetylase OafA/YrhL